MLFAWQQSLMGILHRRARTSAAFALRIFCEFLAPSADALCKHHPRPIARPPRFPLFLRPRDDPGLVLSNSVPTDPSRFSDYCSCAPFCENVRISSCSWLFRNSSCTCFTVRPVVRSPFEGLLVWERVRGVKEDLRAFAHTAARSIASLSRDSHRSPAGACIMSRDNRISSTSVTPQIQQTFSPSNE
ncbi:hypothetical protein OH77DRAFT_626632 [Trametes cingulata]|nr:hypothetical protein OH77DRAFT_626632 [Trametes cingulata]